MNRKARRALERRGGQTMSGSAGNTGAVGRLAKLRRDAAMHLRRGELAAAERLCRQILTVSADDAEAHGLLGAILMEQGKAGEAIPHFQYVIALKPNLGAAYENFGRACYAAGEPKLAIGAARRALELDETATTKTLFTQCVRDVRFTADDGRIRTLMLRALAEDWDRPRELAGACISLVKLNSVVQDFVARVNSAWPARLPALELHGPLMTALSGDQLLGSLLACDTITEVSLERLLTNVRFAMLTSDLGGAPSEGLLGFYCALARQCFINHYVFSVTEAEASQARRARLLLENALVTGEQCPPQLPAIVGAYYPLHTLSRAEALLDRSWPPSVRALLVQQVKEPAEEQRLAPQIPLLSKIEGEVSHAVRQQYEESPYPRWVKAGPVGQPIVLRDRTPQQRLDVLMAGCGTGRPAIEFARQTPRARVLAIDLSLASLCYACRMAQKYGVSNLEFGQADIMTLAVTGREFDYIDASGVLHHLADPWEGWRSLLTQLRPGGVMRIGLYSQLARQSVVAARAWIAERGYRPIPEDIRRCREEVMGAGPDSLLRSVIRWKDFFSLNECRDLLFHVQEHQVTLPDIKVFLATNGLQFAGFMLDAPTLQRFATRFPQPSATTDLDRWQEFEIEGPDTFAAMYQFWVRKPTTPDSNNVSRSDP